MNYEQVLEQCGYTATEGYLVLPATAMTSMPYDVTCPVCITGVTRENWSAVKAALGLRKQGETALHLCGAGVMETATLAEATWLSEEAVGVENVGAGRNGDSVGEAFTVVVGRDVSGEDTPFSLNPLRDVVATLRGPHGCPWDAMQTHRSLRRYLLEEVYEVLEAIDEENPAHVREELGDVLLQIVFHARLAEEAGYFKLQDVIQDISDKMIRRHPHVFETATSSETGKIILDWEALKQLEKKNERNSILDGVSIGLPALLRAQKLQEKAAKVGFDWDSAEPAWEKFQEEIDEFKAALAEKDDKNAELEGGDVLFSLINLLRWYKISGENALHLTNNKFQRRFRHVEDRVRESGGDWKSFSLEALDSFWDEAKMLERTHSK